jgi:hypothetical protein
MNEIIPIPSLAIPLQHQQRHSLMAFGGEDVCQAANTRFYLH